MNLKTRIVQKMPILLSNENQKGIDNDILNTNEESYKMFPFELSAFQKFSICGLTKGHHSLSCVPTGSGKTVPALFAIDYFTRQSKKVIYTSPIKALSNQKFYEFSQKFPNISFGIMTGDIKVNMNASVLIMTAEILQYKLLKKSEKTVKDNFDLDLNDVGCIIHDEIHMINDENRGHVWENILTLTPPHIQMVLLSATLDGPEHFAEWLESLNPEKKVYLATSHKRSVPLVHYGYCIAPKHLMKNIKKNKELTEKVEETQDCFIEIQNENGFLQDHYHKLEKIKDLQLQHNVRISKKFLLDSLLKNMVEKEMFPAVCFVLSKQQIHQLATEVDTELLPFDSKIPYTIDKECTAILRQKFSNYKEFTELPEFDFLMKLLRRGIAIHHSSMIPIFRELVEILFERGYIKLLFATETFSVGLNMPIRTTIFTGIHKFDGVSQRMFLSHEFTQASGRAGRRGMDEKGYVVHLFNLYRPFDLSAFRIMMKGDPQKLSSKFKFSWDLILKSKSDENEANKNDVFFKNLMLSKEINDEIKKQEIKIENEKLLYFQTKQIPLKTPKDVMMEYENLSNKKSKKKFHKLNLLTEEYPSILEDLKKEQNLQTKFNYIHNLEETLDEYKNFIKKKITKTIILLKNNGFMNNDNELLPFGNYAMNIKEVPCLVIAKIIPELAKFDCDSIILFLSCFTNIRVMEEFETRFSHCHFLEQELHKLLKTTLDLAEYFSIYESNHDIESGENYEMQFNLLEIMTDWIEANDELKCIQVLQKYQHIPSGDFVKAILKICNLVLQLEEIAEQMNNICFLKELKKIPDRIMKFIATNQSLYV